MENSCAASLTDAARLVRLLKIGGYCATKSTRENSCKIGSRWHVDGYEWELRICPDYFHSSGITPWVALELSLLSGSSSRTHVRTILGCRMVDPTGILKPSEEKRKFGLFSIPSPESAMSTLKLIKREDLESSGYLQDDAFTLQCTITVLRELPLQTFSAVKEITVQAAPPSNLHQQLGELLQSEAGADVTFVVSGESFAAHKLILAARSPVFMAQFYGQMMEKSSQQVDIKDMEAAVFKALLGFVYTDTVPEFEEQHQDKEAVSTTVMAQHLLAAADRYGIGRLKLICEGKLSGGIHVDTVAASLALAELHRCELLKAKCIDFIVRSPTVLDDVLATEGYKNLEASCPSVLTDLLTRATKKSVV
ncbi:BTB/POZ and MATH domain-containing protein 1-like [Lolium rigidum]|uniref:BTB/POZ and MATH domain-containing protein 1-like n=1 Tax=Lolium rigidum TaxID=89674 RepID=UPI001F5D4532|nr:BTB/POZ and MATH domain-containing protein 1-like [Lolium rigidum]